MSPKRISAFITAPLLALAAAGAITAAAVPASASTGPVIGTKAQAGYQASGRNFRFIATDITVPDINNNSLNGLYPTEYVQLSNGTQLSTTPILGSGDQYVRAGIVPCVVADNHGARCNGWTAFVTTYSNGLNGPAPVHYFPLSVNAGDGVKFSVYYDQAGQDLHFVITPPNASGQVAPSTYEETVAGALFDHAAVLDDFTDNGGAPVQIAPFLHPLRINQFLAVALTTYSGTKGSLVGSWATSEVEATSNGLTYPDGTVRVSPNAPFGDGLPANGAVRPDDAAGIWAR